MNVVLFVIGDEILSGKRQDQHVPKVIDLLAARGIELSEVRMLGDDESRIAEAFRQVLDRGDVILSCGGIGATPDDCTRQAVARALGVPVQRHPEAEALIVERFGEKSWPNRVLMADFPAGASLIPNPVNNIAGFAMERLWCVPGFPQMAWPMLEWVLDGPLRHLQNARPRVEFRLRIYGSGGEGELLPLMERTLAQFPGIALSSLPHMGDAERERHIEFGIKGQPELAAPAYLALREALQALPPPARIEELVSP